MSSMQIESEKNERERIAVLETEFKNFSLAINELRGLIKEEFLKIRQDFAEERKQVNSRLDKHDDELNIQRRFREKLLAQIGVIIGVGAFFMTFVFELIKQWIHSFLK